MQAGRRREMAPSQSPSTLPSSSQSQKKQQSISNFFSAKPSSTPKPPLPSAPGFDGRQTASENELFVSDGELANNASLRDDQHINGRKRHSRESDHDKSASLPTPKRQRRAVEDVENEVPASNDEGHDSEDNQDTSRRRKQSGQANSTSLHLSDRTSKYLFGSSQAESDTADEDEQARRHREVMHEKFVKKLGRPDAIAEIKRRNHIINEETEALDGEDGHDDEEEQETSKPAAKGRKGAQGKKTNTKLTPMEKQYLDIKRNNVDTVLVVEVGYKYRFFGEDARIAAKELHIVCIPGKFRYDEHPSEAHIDRFASASFPTHRLHVHVKRLVQAGHKVGVVRQLETAALKAVGDNRNTPFVRKLTNLYTKGTYIDDVEGLEGPVAAPSGGTPATGHLLCVTETNAKGWGTDEKVHFGLVAVQPTTGDIIYDDFEDGFMRSELETRLLHISPCEFLIVGDVSKATDKLIQHLSGSKMNVFGDRVRLERVEKPKTMAAQSYSHISAFYAGKVASSDSSDDKSALLDKVHKLSEHVTICLSAMITHLTDYGLEHVFDLTKYFQSFSARSHMLLNGNTLSSLEIFQNQTDQSVNGSLFWALDRTQTRFGQRLMRKWVGRPLLDRTQLNERTAALEELLNGDRTRGVDKLKHLLKLIKGDLEKSLIRIYYKKCTRSELLVVLQTLQMIANEYAHVESPAQAGFKSSLISDAIASLPRILQDVVAYLERINLQAAKDDDKYSFFREEHETEDITDHKVGIVSIEYDLNDHKKTAAEKLRKSKVDYVTVAGIEFLIEVENNAQIVNVPASWAKISGTKKVSRFHTPEVVKLIRERDQRKEALANACDAAFVNLLTEIGSKYQAFRDCVQSLAVLDCLLSLAEIASQPGYTKPEFTDDEAYIEIRQGRHPMVEQLLLDTYVPNDITLSSSATRALLITGPNMGGKSSYVRSVALIAIMAQIGSYVPADSARLSLLDAVFTRMGAFDNMMKGESTFMVELSETADILKQATPRSLVVLDELGRGTSTHDGVAIAHAVLDYVLRQTRAMTLFITHYQTLARMSDEWPADELRNVHMRFEEHEEGEGHVTFLYEVGEGTAHRSYGLNVARLAGLPGSVLDVAAGKSKEMEAEERKRRLAYLSRMLPRILSGGEADAGLEMLVAGIEQM